MEALKCNVCRRPKAILSCGILQEPICKKCVVILEKGSFSYLPEIPPELTHKHYCGRCYDDKVAPQLADYESTMARARQLFVYVKGQGEETRLMGRNEKPIRIEHCVDKNETLLRLAFLAARKGFNALLDVEVLAKKVRDEGFQTTSWSASGIPTQLDAKWVERSAKLRTSKPI